MVDNSPAHLHEQVGREGREACLPQHATLGATGARDALKQLRGRPLLQARREGDLQGKQCLSASTHSAEGLPAQDQTC